MKWLFMTLLSLGLCSLFTTINLDEMWIRFQSNLPLVQECNRKLRLHIARGNGQLLVERDYICPHQQIQQKSEVRDVFSIYNEIIWCKSNGHFCGIIGRFCWTALYSLTSPFFLFCWHMVLLTKFLGHFRCMKLAIFDTPFSFAKTSTNGFSWQINEIWKFVKWMGWLYSYCWKVKKTNLLEKKVLKKGENNSIQGVTFMLEIVGTNVSTTFITYITCPTGPKKTSGIKLKKHEKIFPIWSTDRFTKKFFK